MMIKTLEWTDQGVMMIDQRLLPAQEIYPVFKTYEEVAWAIKEMVIRGAPAIGIAAAMGIALGVRDAKTEDANDLDKAFERICEVMGATRPTAVNLFWAIDRMRRLYAALRKEKAPLEEIRSRLIAEAKRMHEEDVDINRAMGRHGAELLPDDATVLTHCNAGALATAGYGTALGVVRAAIEAGKRVAVYADETRPFLQGARLTAWELNKEGIPVTLITDNMAGHFLKRGDIDCVVVGADRIAANGDVANKIGTYSVAVLAKENDIPFYVAAPISTLDLNISSGDQIPIEERNEREITHVKDVRLAPDGIKIANPAFDVTPNRYIAAIITERGVARPPYQESLKRLAQDEP
ncbi:MAG TPA: S-methyl-5-thioribose-1-phosphate isomerase [Blastocatellia bacterium]|nr:S-methyl-5-thioribose-1-phosphate isomerase [Blastocatellia bacterium]